MSSPVHLFVLVHGLWGDTSHLQSMKEVLLELAALESTAVGIEVLLVQGNENDKTYDGIDINASRVVEELDAEIERLEGEGREVKYLSMAGYSLGGLVSRYALGILYCRPEFFSKHQPLNFATFASPWIGSLKYNTLFNKLFTAVGSRFVSRSGEQLFCVDKEQLVARLARKDDIFYKALLQFSRIDVFANAQNDRTVPFPSGAFMDHDPFEDWETSGLEVATHEGSPIISSYHLPSPSSLITSSTTSSSPSSPQESKASSGLSTPSNPKGKPKRKHILPPFLRFRFPLNILFFLCLPLLMPIALSLILLRFSRESRRSRRRLKAEDSESLWARVRELEKALEAELGDGLAVIGGETEGGVKSANKDGKVSGLRLTGSQRGMIRSLDQLPQMQKWFAWFPESFNSHAMIIGRDPKRFPDHGKGRLIIKFWTDRVILESKDEKESLVDV